jgi:hypothetical protein
MQDGSHEPLHSALKRETTKPAWPRPPHSLLTRVMSKNHD